jgi:serine protease
MKRIFTLSQVLLLHLCIFFIVFCMPAHRSLAQVNVQLSSSPAVVPYTLVFKLKPQHKTNARLNSVQSESFNRAFKAVAAREVTRKFPRQAPSTAQTKAKPNSVDLSLVYELRYDSGLSFEKARKLIEATGMVEYVEPVYFRDVLSYPNDPMADSLSGSQYYLKKINAYKAWAVEQGDTNVVVGIVDTGTRFSHQDLGGKIKYNYADPIDGIDNDGDGYVDNFRGWDAADNDNDPTADNYAWTGTNGHGVAVAGVAAALTNNKKGVAGIGYNTKFLPIKAYSSKTGGRFGGYEAIIYAADRGCKVINLSWGGAGNPSAYEQDIINYAAINKDVVIVAAAGNTHGELNFYPASYDNVLSVGMTDQNDVKGQIATYSYKIDLMAPGIKIHTTTHGGDSTYGGGNGSSFAAPMVAGSAALVRSRFPHYNALQVAEQLRVTTDNIYHLAGNQPYNEMLGSGRLNLYRALTETNVKSVRNTAQRVSDVKQTYPGNTFAILADFTNYLTPTSNLVVTLTSSSPFVTIQQNTFRAGAMASMARKNNNSQPFLVQVADNVPSNEKVLFRISYQDGSYTDYQYFRVTLNPDVLTVDVNQLAVSINSKGNFGYDGSNTNRGVGVTYKGGRSLLSEGGLLIGTSPAKVSDNLRNEKYTTDNDFFSLDNIKPRAQSSLDHFRATGVMRDSTNARTVGVSVNHRVYAWTETADEDYVILEYAITNATTDTLKGLHAGLFGNWDVFNPTINVADWDAENQLGYVYSPVSPTVFAGIKLLTGTANYYAFESSGGSASAITLSEEFSTKDKFTSLSSGTQFKAAGRNGQGNDVAHVVSSSFAPLAPGQTVTVAFALLAGDNLAALKNSAKAAQARYQTLGPEVLTARPKEKEAEERIRMYPNPSAGNLVIDVQPSFLAGSQATVEVFDLIGNRLQHHSVTQAESVTLNLNGYANGVYLVRMTSNQGVVTRKVQLKR